MLAKLTTIIKGNCINPIGGIVKKTDVYLKVRLWRLWFTIQWVVIESSSVFISGIFRYMGSKGSRACLAINVLLSWWGKF